MRGKSHLFPGEKEGEKEGSGETNPTRQRLVDKKNKKIPSLFREKKIKALVGIASKK